MRNPPARPVQRSLWSAFAAKCAIALFAGSLAGPIAAHGQDIVFPPAPDAPRVRYLYSLSGPQDIKPKVSGFRAFLLKLAGKGPRSGQAMVRPYGVYAASGRVFVADTGGMAVAVFDRGAKRLTRIGGSREGSLINPIDVAADEAGNIYVTDSGLNLVKVYGPDGNFLRQLGTASGLSHPTGIVYDAGRKRLIVADTGNSRLVLFDAGGKMSGTIGRRGTEKGDMSVPINLALDREGDIYVVENMLSRVQIYSPEGVFLSQFGKNGDLPGYFARPRGIALDSDGNIYVVDALMNMVQIFDREGKLLLFFGGGGAEPGTFQLPAGIFIDPEDRIYVVDSNNRRVQVFQYLKPPPK
ncbi:MAG: 6-bladed beta-propeller [Elusimicrobia bacterium]|nr:6-bladed beta-propeller [Elusimicrobiota bacterium]